MATVSAPPAEVGKRLPPDGGVTIAVSAPGTTVIAGDPADMDMLLASGILSGLDVRLLEVERAFHSASMDAAAEVVRAAAAKVPARHPGPRPGLRIVSSMTGEVASAEALCAPEYWSRHLRNPMLLDAAADTVLATGCGTFLELGPGSSMIASLRRTAGWSSAMTALPMLGRAGNEERGLLCALGNLWERGVDAVADVAPEPATRCALPPHSMDRADPEEGLLPPAGQRDGRGQPSPAPAAPSRNGARAQPGARELRPVIEELWCSALGVPSVRATDDFYELGGESLTAVDLLSRLRQAAGLALSVTAFSRDPTFGALVSLAERERAAGQGTAGETAAVRAVALHGDDQGSSSESPVFLAADATANALSYLPLAGLLAGIRRVYGLEPTDAGMARMPIEDSAARHVDALLRVQEAGPYILGGWSFGAVIAHEMAFQLAARGERTAVLLCLDGYAVTGSLPLALAPGFLLLQASALLRIGAVGHAARRNPRLRATLTAKYRLLAQYRPRPVDCPAVVFKAGSRQRGAATLARRLSPLYGGGVRVVPATGDHWSMLSPPHVQGLARFVRDALPAVANELTHPIPRNRRSGSARDRSR
jgi:phthiocerol/phenolphthiocerol synthesis type-I polyketide synthase E